MYKLLILSAFVMLNSLTSYAQFAIPASYSNIGRDTKGLYFEKEGNRYYADTAGPRFTLEQMIGKVTGTDNGISYDFLLPQLEGRLVFGLIPFGQAPHPAPVFRSEAAIREGKAELNIKSSFRDPYDMIGWQKSGQMHIGYRIITKEGVLLFDGITGVEGTGPFKVVPAIYEGPFVNNITPTSAVISFETTLATTSAVELRQKESNTKLVKKNSIAGKHHEITFNDLKPGTKYTYTAMVGNLQQTYHFSTAPAGGSRKPFVFAYASDSRAALGGGERSIYGANAYIMKKVAAVAFQNKSVFMQFTGDMINGYMSNKEDQLLQYSNWKKSIEGFWHYMPFYVGQGNHEALGYIFKDSAGRRMAFIDKFPYETESAEAIMAQAFVSPENGPDSEDGNKYDPDKTTTDFPSYKENVFYYTYDNVAMVVLNSDYWFAPSLSSETSSSGGLHGYLMDNQIAWLKQIISKLEKDDAIDHIFLTQHTPIFPNGGHVGDDMWYRGNNEKRPFIAGKPVDKGIIERRDEYLDILINDSKKVVAVLTGDEHNYNRMKLTSAVNIYPDNWRGKKLKVSRPIYQINNGAAGAPYYAQEITPWSEHTKAFSVENAVCLFYVDGKSIRMKVINPDMMNTLDEIQLR